MPIIFNFKVCDNAAECNGLEVCPVKAISWDKDQKTLLIDNQKCISCGACVNACPVKGAILLAETDEIYKKLKEQVEDDPRTRAELFKDRYGIPPTDQNLIVTMKNFNDEVLETDRVVIVDFWDELHLGCRINSVPLEELLPKAVALSAIVENQEKLKGVKYKFRKIDVKNNPEISNRYGVNKIPSLLFFYRGALVGRIEGAYSEDRKKELNEKVLAILKKLE